jgi:hypothetical protein
MHCVGRMQSFLDAKTDYTYSYHCFKALISPLINTFCGLAALGGGGGVHRSPRTTGRAENVINGFSTKLTEDRATRSVANV